MVKKYSPTVNNGTPAMKTDASGHFVHRDDYFKVKKHVEDFLSAFLNAEFNVLATTLEQQKSKTREFLDSLEN